MDRKCFYIVCVLIFKVIEIKSECHEQFKCLSEFLKDFINSIQGYEISIKEIEHDQNKQLKTTVKTIEITSNNLHTVIKQIISLFNIDLEDYHETINIKVKKLPDKDYNTNTKPTAAVSKTKEFNSVDFDSNIQISRQHTDPKDKDIDENDISIDGFNEYYDNEFDNATDYPIIDYIDLYKDTTNELTEVVTTEVPQIAKVLSTDNPARNYSQSCDGSFNNSLNIQRQCHNNVSKNDITRSVLPWIAAIFIKSGTGDQFDYYCDGVLLSKRTILTAARCVTKNDITEDADNIIVILGKRSLLYMGENEKAVKIKKIEVHENFTNAYKHVENDLAILEIEEPIEFNDAIQPACIAGEDESDGFFEDRQEIATTGWAYSGELTSIPFDKERSKDCHKMSRSEEMFCAKYYNENTVCPSYGGVFVTKSRDDIWHLKGVRSDDDVHSNICTNSSVFYTNLLQHYEWIQTQMEE